MDGHAWHAWDNKVHSRDHARRHEKTQTHLSSVQYHCSKHQGAFDAGGCVPGDGEKFPSTHDQSMHGIGLILEEISVPNVEDGFGEYIGADFDEEGPGEQDGETLDSESEVNVFMGTGNEGDTGMKSDGQMTTSEGNEWFPWPNKLSCTIDILMHIPCSVFSQHQLDLLMWLLHINGIQDVPSVRTMKTLEDGLQKICGIETLPFTGAFGHQYYMNSFSDIIRQVENSGGQLNEAYQARRWLKEMDPTQLTPMICLHGQDFFIFEPALLSNGQVCMPIRWFKCGGLFFAKAWSLHAVVNDTGSGWIVEGHTEIEISERNLLVSFKNWNISQSTSVLPPAHNILGMFLLLLHLSYSKQLGIENSCQAGLLLEPWTLTNPHQGNHWCVYGFPIWLYCDDTSGNVSKRWNKHHSFLFTPAGLPHAAVHQEYNVHFLCTSNVAPPLEMLDGFVNQLEAAQETGVWAWDCVHKEQVLMIPSVLALLGDNPMQSELACHVGLRGKYFCCVCNVKGHDTQDLDTNANDETLEQSDGGQSDGQRLSIIELKSMFTMASTIGNQTKIKEKMTSTGLKDTYLEYFINGMAASCKRQQGSSSKQEALDVFIKGLPENVYSPVWRIKGLNPHADTPVEVLHTVLLGFVKYFWRDVVNIRVGKNKIKHELLEAHLSSFDTTGLGIPPLSGHTLVQYAGSLVGHDFHAIAQAAPFVLHGLVPQECYEAWVALSKMIPLIWKPEIEDVDAHLTQLEIAIQEFLARTACWTPHWFNKPKFHILLHLPEHIHPFGPAALFATEGFESFNAVIHAKSAFAHGNRIHHILSGAPLHIHANHPNLGVQIKKLIEKPPLDALNAGDAGVWWPAGTALLTLVSKPNIITDYLGMDSSSLSKPGSCVKDNLPWHPYHETRTGQQFPTALSSLSQEILHDNNFHTCRSMILMNGDRCIPGQWVLIHQQNGQQPLVAQVKEIIQRQGSTAEMTSSPDAIFLQSGKIQGSTRPYQMPLVQYDDTNILLPIEVSLLHLSIHDT
ncbi:hypothetical protein F5J12DRAFT_907093 [Pisolithus orientalis]|uniref:uncharacterized protein n=1 Tax=Pisolithus orientalis TaxID=936130 RepID=UPI0022240709|nr:uncharacterized protein F5J12DRAFT_907093 [Pisolithus orientalis]KAI5996522.1 hypothetical protein F5J12DRAFT_907093 [Pisolithus orientalis]